MKAIIADNRNDYFFHSKVVDNSSLNITRKVNPIIIIFPIKIEEETISQSELNRISKIKSLRGKYLKATSTATYIKRKRQDMKLEG